MTQKRSLNYEKITFENIREELSTDFEDVCKELYDKLKEEPKYKRLKRIGEEQFYSAPFQASAEMENQNMRLSLAKINILASNILDDLEKMIAEKFQEDFLTSMKAKVLNAVLKLYSEKKYAAQVASEDFKTSSITSGCSSGVKEDEKIILERLKDLSKFCADNLIDIRNQVIEMPLEENEISATENPKKEISSEPKLKKLDSSTAIPKKKVSSESKAEKLESGATSKKKYSNESKVEKLDNATANPMKTISNESEVENLDSATTNSKKKISSGSKVKKLESATSSESKVGKRDTNNSNAVKKKTASLVATRKRKLPEKSNSKNNKEIKAEVDLINYKQGNIDAENLSCSDSLSSVHTSDLSSFDDEMLFSSDEETGEKERRMPMKEVAARLAEISAKKLAAEKESQDQVKMSENEHISQSETPVNESLSIPGKTLPQRVRKPNSKYIKDVIQISLRKSSTEKNSAFSRVSTVDNSLPRKQRRSRKHLI